MNAALFALCVMTCLGGLGIAWAGATGHVPARASSTVSTGLWTRSVDNLRRVRRATWLSLAGGVGLGVVAWVRLGWPLLLVLVPLAVWGLPRLLADPVQHEVRTLEALDRWVRFLLGHLSTGKSIQDSLRVSHRNAPDLLAEPLARLVKRLDDRWSAPQALMALAGELDSPDADAVLAALILSTQRGGTGAAITLHALADNIHDRLRALREIEAERSKPRAVVRQVVVITVLALVAFLMLSPTYFGPYGTPVGQAILVALLVAYVGAIWFMRRLTLPRSRARILRSLP